MNLTDDFTLEEFMPRGHPGPVPQAVLDALASLCSEVLQPARTALARAFVIHSGWRPADYNEAVGGAPGSDHGFGRAADFHVVGRDGQAWEEATREAFFWIRSHLHGIFGQLILEDHRVALRDPGKLWVHAASRSEKHPGIGHDPNRVLFSASPKQYELYDDALHGGPMSA